MTDTATSPVDTSTPEPLHEHTVRTLRLMADTSDSRWARVELLDAVHLIEALVALRNIQQGALRAEAEVFQEASRIANALMVQAQKVVDYIREQNIRLMAENAGQQADIITLRAALARAQM